MITFVYPIHPDEGYRLDLSCPAILCDACGQLIDADHPGNLLWRARDDDASWHVHKGACDRTVEQAAGEHLLSREIADWVAQLAYNYAHPLIGGKAELISGSVYPIVAVRTMASDRDRVEAGDSA